VGKLNTVKVRNAKPGTGANGQPIKSVYQDGDGLFLICAPSGAKSWMLRVQVDGKRRDIGLGSVDVDGAGRNAFADGDNRLAETPIMLRKSLMLGEAREKAAALRKLAKAGQNPVTERDRLRVKVPTFAEALIEAHKALSSGWNEKTAKAFLASLQEHALPKLGALKVNAISGSDLIAALAPIWNDKPVMARKVRNRIGQVLAFAKARGWRAEALPDVRELRSGLSKQAAGGHFKAMPYAECAGFFTSQWALDLSASRAAMLFAMLTGNRSGSVRQATWEQVDMTAREWKCPAENMKGGRAHDVALSDSAIALLERFQPDAESRKGLIFPGQHGKPLSDMSLTKALRTAGRDEAVHGWRTSFRSWAGENMPHIPWNVAELAIAHKVGTATEKAYNRADYFTMRRALFDGWGAYVAPFLSDVTGNVVTFRGAQPK
jgi:integrase